jgi:hypothetical protein
LIYLIIGLIFSIYFALTGAKKIDENMNGAKIGVRLILIPGATALWPFLIKRIRKSDP